MLASSGPLKTVRTSQVRTPLCTGIPSGSAPHMNRDSAAGDFKATSHQIDQSRYNNKYPLTELRSKGNQASSSHIYNSLFSMRSILPRSNIRNIAGIGLLGSGAYFYYSYHTLSSSSSSASNRNTTPRQQQKQQQTPTKLYQTQNKTSTPGSPTNMTVDQKFEVRAM